MRAAIRWIFVILLSIIGCLLVTWGVAVALPKRWVAEEDLRLLIATAAGVTAGGVIGLWGKTFATAGREGADVPEAEGAGESEPTHDVVIEGRQTGILSAGQGDRNYQGKNPTNLPAGREKPDRSGDVGNAAKRRLRIRVKDGNEGIISLGDGSTNIQDRS